MPPVFFGYEIPKSLSFLKDMKREEAALYHLNSIRYCYDFSGTNEQVPAF